MSGATDKPLPPGGTGLPLLGETLEFAKNAFAFGEQRTTRYGPVWRTHLLGRKTVFFASPDGAAAFVDPENCQRSGALPDNIRAMFGGVAVNSMDGEAHTVRKRTIMAAFTREALASYLPTLEKIVADQLKAWAARGAEPLLDDMKRLAVEVVAKTTLGIDSDGQIDALLSDIELVGGGLAAPPIPLPGTTFTKAKKAVDRMLATLTSLVAERRRNPGADGLSLMLAYDAEQGEGLSDGDVAKELHHMLIAGFIVYAELIASVQRLDEHPEVRDRLRGEITSADATGVLTPSTLARMGYLQQVCNELRRTTPVVPFALGLAKRTFEVGGFQIPKGWMLGMLIRPTMHSHGVFTDPDKFDPDRFGPERAEHERHAESMVPQGAGDYVGRGHKCAGYDFSTVLMNVFAVHLVRDYDWELPSQDVTLRMAQIPPAPRDGLIANLEQRR